jgi:hypothetical protein
MNCDDITTRVIAAYSKGGQLAEYERRAAKQALTSTHKPEHAFSIAVRFLDQILSHSEQEAKSEMLDLARKYPIKEIPEAKKITNRWDALETEEDYLQWKAEYDWRVVDANQ